MKKLPVLVTLSAFLFMLVFSQSAQAVTSVTSCGTRLSVSGETYVLQNDLKDDLNPLYRCLLISGHNIVLDGNGYTIQGWGEGEGSYFGVSVMRKSGITVKNLKIAGYKYALYFEDGDNTNIFDNIFYDNMNGVHFASGSDNGKVHDNLFSSNHKGILVGASSNNEVYHNTFDSNIFGAHIGYGGNYDNRIYENTFTSNIYATYITATSHRNSIDHNDFTGGTSCFFSNCGRLWSRCTGNIIDSNNIIGAQWGNGIYITNGGSYWEITNNVIKDSKKAGVYISRSGYNSISGNIIEGNTPGIILNYNQHSTVWNNVFRDNIGHAQQDGGYNVYFYKSLPAGGNWYSGFTCTDPDGDGICGTGASCDQPYTLMSGQQDCHPWFVEAGWECTVDPVTTLTLPPADGQKSWYVTDVLVGMSSEDGCGGTPDIYYSLNSGPATSYTSSFTISTEGVNTLEYWSLAGATEEVHNFATIMLDKTAPTITIDSLPEFDADGSWTLSWTANDGESSVLKYDIYRSTNDGAFIHYIATPFEYATETGGNDATKYTYYVKVTDWAGHSTDSGQTSTTVDLSPPSVPNMNPLPTWTGQMTVNVDWDESVDEVSGVNHYDLYRDSAAYVQTSYSTTQYADIVVVEAGSYTYEVTATDNVDHESARSDPASTTIDTIAPETLSTILGVLGNDNWYVSDVFVLLAATDATSGIADIYYRIGSAEWMAYTGSIPLTADTATVTVYYYSIDQAGNQEAQKSVTFKIDQTPPVTTAAVTGTEQIDPYTGDVYGNWYTDTVSVGLSATDALSGLAGTYYCTDQEGICVPDTAYAGTITVSEQGPNAVRFRSDDLAGNLEEVSTQLVLIDKDTDGDGIYDNFDACREVAGILEFHGCPNGVEITAELHKIQPGTPSTREPLENILVFVYDRADLAAAGYGSASWQNYGAIVNDNTIPFAASCMTDEEGSCMEYIAGPADYLVIGVYMEVNNMKFTTKHLGSSISADDANWIYPPGYVTKKLTMMEFKKEVGVEAKKIPGSNKKIKGSELDIIYPEYVEWVDLQEVYPFIFTSDENWTVDVCLEVPEGYMILEPGACSQTFVSGEAKTINFIVEKVGSPPDDFGVEITGTHNGKGQKVRGDIGTLFTSGLQKAMSMKAGTVAKGKPFTGAFTFEMGAIAAVIILVAIGGAYYFFRIR